jgi:hypothetical protein
MAPSTGTMRRLESQPRPRIELQHDAERKRKAWWRQIPRP